MIPGIWELLNHSLSDLNLTIIWSYQNAPRMDKPYVVIDYVDNDLPNFECVDPYIDENGLQDIGSWRRATVSLQFYCGPNSVNIASQSSLRLSSNRSVEKQVALDVAIGNRLMLQRVPALLNNSQFEDRAIFQFDFYYTDHYKDDVGIIEAVEVDGTFTGSLTEQHCSQFIQIPNFGFSMWDDGNSIWDDGTSVWDSH